VTRLVERQETCESVFRHSFSAIKRKSRSRKQNINKCKKRKKVKHSERKREILRKIAPDLPEGLNNCQGIPKKTKKCANALASSEYNLLEYGHAKEELRIGS
jgi:hypothetical protein